MIVGVLQVICKKKLSLGRLLLLQRLAGTSLVIKLASE